MSWDGWQTFTHVQSKSAGMTFHENITIPNSPKNDLVLPIIAIDIGKKVVCWRRKHISFPFLPLPRTTELRFQLITCSNRPSWPCRICRAHRRLPDLPIVFLVD